MTRTHAYRLSFPESVTEICRCLRYALEETSADLSRLDAFEDCVYIKNRSGVLRYANEPFQKSFAPRESPVGQAGSDFLNASVCHTALHSDALVLAGNTYVELEHIGATFEGQAFVLQTQKRSIRSLGYQDYEILGITRLVRPIAAKGSDAHRLDAKRLHDAFESLAKQDQEICRLVALGQASAEIGEQLGMTQRNVEIRRKKIFAALGVKKPIELAKGLVRLEERGYLDLGL